MAKFCVMYNCVLLCILILCKNGFAKLAPDYIHPCGASNWNQCVISSAQSAIPEFVKGIPELGVESLDPFLIERLAIPLSGFNVTFHKGKVTGFKKAAIDNIKFDLEANRYVMELHTNLTIRGQYTAVGQILVFPINGEGDAKIKLTNLRIKVDVTTKYYKDKRGIDHLGIKSYTFSFDYGEKVTFDLKNLFKESKELSDTVLLFLNENWRTVAEEFGKPIVDYAVDLVIKTTEKFFRVVPFNELIDVPIPQY